MDNDKGGLPKSKLRPETKKLVHGIFDRFLRSIGLPTLDESLETSQKMFASQPGEEPCQALFKILTAEGRSGPEFKKMFGVTWGLALRNLVETMQEPRPEQLNELAATFETLPVEIRAMLDESVKSIKQKLPRKVGAGRKSSLTLEQKKEACLSVGVLMAQGVALRDAVARVGLHFGVGARTIQRAWQKRRALHQGASSKTLKPK